MQAPEKQLAANLIRLLKQQQAREGVEARFYSEVKLPDGTCPDLVIHRTDIPDREDFTAIYQCKMVMSEALLRQCIASQQWADVVIAAVGGMPACGREMTRRFLGAGVGVITLGAHMMRVHHGGVCIPGHVEILKYLNEHNGEGGTFAAAGSRSDRRATKENIIAQAVEKYVAENPGCSFKQIRKGVPALSKAWGNFERMARLSVYRVRIDVTAAPAKIYPMEVTSNA